MALTLTVSMQVLIFSILSYKRKQKHERCDTCQTHMVTGLMFKKDTLAVDALKPYSNTSTCYNNNNNVSLLITHIFNVYISYFRNLSNKGQEC